MTYPQILLRTILSASFLNALFSLCVLPLFLFFLKQQIPLLGWETGLFFILSTAYLIRIFKRSAIGYIYSAGFIAASMVFMRVSAGNTIPTWIVLLVIAVVGFLSQEILSDSEMKRSELPRQLVVSGSVLSFFLWYSFLFGAIFVTTIHPGILFAGCLVYTGAMSWVILQLYRIPQAPLLAGIIAWGIATLYRVLRFVPYTHITQAGILTVIVFYSIFVFREIYYLEGPILRPLLIRLALVGILLISILGSAG